MLKCLATTTLVLFSSFSAITTAQAQKGNAVNIAIGKPGSESFVFGIELWAMSQITLKPQHGIYLSAIEVADEDERLVLLKDAGVEVALVRGNIPTSYARHMRTVMAIWPDEGLSNNAKPAQIVAREDVSDDIIYRITQAIFENPRFFKSAAKTTFGVAKLDQAMIGADLPIHPGASRYYHEKGVSLSSVVFKPAVHARTEAVAGAKGDHTRGTATFDDFDDTSLNQEERAQVVSACKQALNLGVLSAVLGDLSSSGCEAYQPYLEDQRNDQQLRAAAKPDLLVLPKGQGGPAIAPENVLRRGGQDAKDKHHKRSPRQPIM